MTVLYDYWRSSASYRVRIALNLAGIPYETIPVDLTSGAQNTAAHLKRHPQGRVPVLDIDGHRFTQSLAILDYLNDTRTMSLLPKDPAQAAHVRALAQAVAVDVHPVCNLNVVQHVATLAPPTAPPTQAWMHHFITPGLQAFETLLDAFSQTPFCCGATPTLADLCLIPQLYNARRWGISFTGLDRLCRIEKACNTLPAFAAAHPDRARPA